MQRSFSFRGALFGLAIGALIPAAVNAALVADLAADFVPGALGQSTASFNGGTGLSDTSGTGRWNYLQANTGGGSPTLLTFQAAPGNSGLPAYAGANQAGEGFAMPAITNQRLFGDGVTPPAGFLNVHPGNVEPLEMVARWTAGADGLYNVFGAIADTPPNGNGVNYLVRINGVPMFGRPNGAGVVVGSTQQSYSLFRSLNAGDTVEIAVGPNGGGQWAADETRVSMSISDFAGKNIVANAGGDYTAGSAGQTSTSVGIADTAGSGTWNYFSSNDVNLDLATQSQLLTFGALGNGGNSGFGGGLDGFNMPGVSNGRLFGDGKIPTTDELALHPSNANAPGGREFLVLRWTAGVSGDIDILGNLYTQLTGSNGTDFHILVDGVEVFTSINAGGGLPASFSLPATITAGSHVDFVLGNNVGFGGDESIFRAYIVQNIVPEPTTLSCLALASLALLRRRRTA